MAASLFDSTVIEEAQAGMNFMANLLESSSDNFIICKGLEGKILLWNEGARFRRKAPSMEQSILCVQRR
jgi:hypothetical protein